MTCAPYPTRRMRDLPLKISRALNWQTFLWTFICFGIAVRTVQYLSNRSLWIDEATLSLNIISRSFSGLFQPLENNQAAPIGFLLITRLAKQLFGDSEFSLRLFPFLCGLASVFLFYALARRCLTPKATAIAVALFAVTDNLIYYSSEVKQYSSDAAIAIVLSLMGGWIKSTELTGRRAILLILAGAAAIWISHPAAFVLAGVGSLLTLFALRRRQWARVMKLSLVGAVWIASFAASYVTSLEDLSGNAQLERSWLRKGGFMPVPFESMSDLGWFGTTFFGLFNNVLRSPVPWLAAAIFLVGAFSVIRRKRWELLIVMSPALFALLASGLRQYPFARRLAIFLVPALILFIAEGVEYITDFKKPYVVAAGFVIAAFLLVGPLISASKLFVYPLTREEMRRAVTYIESHRQPGDILYLYYGSIPAFEYYKSRFGIAEADYAGVAARNDWVNESNPVYISDLERLLGNDRVWILFSHVRSFKGVNEGDFFLKYLDGKGERLDEIRVEGASAYLYDLNN